MFCGARGKRLLRQTRPTLGATVAHLYETGRMRRVHLRGHANILKRVLAQTAALNLELLMRTLFGVGTRAASRVAWRRSSAVSGPSFGFPRRSGN